jgi:hypothetical protein
MEYNRTPCHIVRTSSLRSRARRARILETIQAEPKAPTKKPTQRLMVKGKISLIS